MSYVLYIWEHPPAAPLPATIPEAARCVGLLRQSKPGHNPKFLALAKSLTARYPALNELPSNEDGEPPDADEYAWVDGELTGETDEAVFNLGLSTGMLDEVRPFVIEEALKLGLNIVDVQAGEVFLADGRTLAVTKKAVNPVPPPEEKKELPKVRDLLRQVAERWAPLMKEHGYSYRKGGVVFKRKFAGGWQELGLDANGDFGAVCCWFGLRLVARLNEVSDLSNRVEGISPQAIAEAHEEVGWRPTLMMSQTRAMCPIAPRPFLDQSGGYQVTSVGQIEPMIEHVGELLKTFWLPMLERCETVAGIDDLLNGEYRAPRTGMRVFYAANNAGDHIIAAFLAGNPRLEEICAAEERTGFKNREGLLRCIEYVRQNFHGEG